MLVIFLIVIICVLISWRPKEDEDDWMDMDISYLDTTVDDDDERLTNSLVNNSGTNFFVRNSRLRQTVEMEKKTASNHLHTFADSRKKAGSNVTGIAGMFSTKAPVRKVVLTADVTATDSKKNSTDKSFKNGEQVSYLYKTKSGERAYYCIAEDTYIPAENTVRLCSRSNFEGTISNPFAVDVNQKQYLYFSEPGQSLYLSFRTDNEFVSLFLSGISGNMSYELYDDQHRKVGTQCVRSRNSVEIYHKSGSAATYILKLTGDPTDSPIQMSFYRDDNEWMYNMTSVAVNQEYTGVFDYYGDEDFFAVNQDISRHADELAIRLSGVDADLQVMAYDENKNLIGRYTRKRGVSEDIVMYGLENLYAISVRTVDGRASSAKYKLRFFYMDVQILGLETFGFKISSRLDTNNNGENYYTASCNGLTDKRITDVQTIGRADVSMTLTTYSGATYAVKEGQELPLHVGKNTLEITIKNPSFQRTLILIITDVNSYDLGCAFVKDTTAMYESPLTTSRRITTLASGTKVINWGQQQNNLCKIELMDGSGTVGWAQTSTLFTDYEICSMPSSYSDSIRRLQKQHPNWKFTYVRVGQSLAEAVSTEAGQSPIIWQNGGWRTPGRSQIEYYMNPLNFLNEQDIFMFEKQTYQPNAYSEAGIGAVWTERSEALASGAYYADCFMEAGKIAGLSPYFIAARAALESGNGTSRLAKGTSSGYEGYYNFYGINAVDSNPTKGAAFAKEHNWNTQRIAIVEGASWIKDQYISVLQYTPYFIKYSFVPGRKWHQYMTDIAAPKQDAYNCYKAHLAGGTLNSAIEFVIPVYD